MPSLQTVINGLPPFGYRKKTIIPGNDQTVTDITQEILNTHRDYETDYDQIYPLFDTGNIYSTCHKIWDFLKYNLQYSAESNEQSVKSPSAILHKGEKIDCKHYSLFTGGVLDSIKANEGESWDWCYRFASEDPDKKIGHVFVVVFDQGREIWVDPVLSSFDQRKHYTKIVDKRPMSLVKISGVNNTPQVIQPKMVTDVNTAVAFTSFLTMINMDLLSFKALAINNPTVTYGPVRKWLEANGFDFNQVINFLNA